MGPSHSSGVGGPKPFDDDRGGHDEKEGDGCNNGVASYDDMVLWYVSEPVAHA